MPRFAPTRTPAFAELVLLLAALMSMMAFSIDSILPALPELQSALTPDAPSRAQLVISSFVFGTGIGQFFIGPFSDSYGRRPALVLGVGLFVIGALGARLAPNLEILLVFRFIQGLGAASSRIVSQAVMRDLFSGRAQARVGSIVFTFFVIVPAVAPLIGQQIIDMLGWRGLFSVYVGIGLVVLAWYMARQPETLPVEARRPFRLGAILAAMWEVLRHPVAFRYLIVVTLAFGQLMGYISSVQQIYDETLGVADMFPIYFAGVAILSAASGFLNARWVMRLGMRPMARWSFASQAVIAGLYWAAWHFGAMEAMSHGARLTIFLIWSVSLFFINGLTFGNITALAMEPMGHIAGTASAVVGALSSMLAVAIAAPVGLAFDGTPRALLLAVLICSALAFLLVATDRRVHEG